MYYKHDLGVQMVNISVKQLKGLEDKCCWSCSCQVDKLGKAATHA